MTTKKILYLINDITMPGGLSRVTINLVDEFSSSNNEYEVHALSAAAKFDKLDNPNVHYLGMPPLHGLSPLAKIRWYFDLKSKVERYVKKNSYDVVIAVGTAMTLFSSFCRFESTQLWGAEHLAHNHYGLLRKVMKRWRYPKLDRLICLTKSDKQRYYDQYLNHVSVIPNYTNFSDVDTTYSNNKKFLFVGRYNDMKGVDYLVDIMVKVSSHCPDWSFVLYGEGEKKKWLENQIEALDLSDIVEVNEPTDNITDEYKAAGVFILTSRNEGFPMVLLEAQAHGLPIVSFDCETGPSEIISDGEDGYLIPAFDVDAFAQQLVKLACDEDKRRKMSAKAVLYRQRFGKEAVISLWLEQFRK